MSQRTAGSGSARGQKAMRREFWVVVTVRQKADLRRSGQRRVPGSAGPTLGCTQEAAANPTPGCMALGQAAHPRRPLPPDEA